MSKKKEKKETYIVKDEKGNPLPIEIPTEFINVLKAMLKTDGGDKKK